MNSGQTAHSSLGPLLLHSHPKDVGLLPGVLCLPSLEHHGGGDYQLDNSTRVPSVLSSKLVQMAGGADLDGSNPGRATSPTGSASSAMPCSPVCSPSCFRSRTPMKGKGGRSPSSSASSLFSRGTQPESPAASVPDEGSNGSTTSEDDSESNGEGEAGSGDGDSDSSASSADESSSSNKSDSGEASDARAPSRVVLTMKARGEAQ